MAIILTPTKHKRNKFFWMIGGVSILVLGFVLLLAFPPGKGNELGDVSEGPSQPNISVNLNILDSEAVRNLEPFEEVGKEFDYTAQDKNGRQVKGKIVAQNIGQAKTLLSDKGLKVLEVKESNIGRNDPFVIYYFPK